MSLISFFVYILHFLDISIFEAFPEFSMNVYNSISYPVQNKSGVFLTKAPLHSFAPGSKRRESRCEILRESRSTLQTDIYSFLLKCYILFFNYVAQISLTSIILMSNQCQIVDFQCHTFCWLKKKYLFCKFTHLLGMNAIFSFNQIENILIFHYKRINLQFKKPFQRENMVQFLTVRQVQLKATMVLVLFLKMRKSN